MNPKILEIMNRQNQAGFNFIKNFEYHKENPHITIEAYSKIFRKNISTKIKNRKKIYLDTKYWIRLRDIERGTNNNTTDKKIYSLVKKLVQEEKVIFPISSTLYIELLLQEDLETRRKTALLMDELSLGISIDFDYELFTNEFIYLFLKYNHSDLRIPRDEFCWVTIGQIIGQVNLESKELKEPDNLATKKTMLDLTAYLKLTDLLELMPERNDDNYKKDKFNLALELNTNTQSLNKGTNQFKKSS